MIAEIKKGTARGKAVAPSSKSMSHRLLICAGLCPEESVIDNIAYSEDILATIDCLEAMGASVKQEGSRVIIKGASPEDAESSELCCRESGSTLRFFLPIMLLSEKKHCFTGYGRLMSRPMEVYQELCLRQGLIFEKDNDKIYIKGPLSGGSFTLRGDISSQFISGLLFALPLCEKDSKITLTASVESRSYIDMTISSMGKFGVYARWENENTLFIPGSQSYKRACLTVEGDYSNAAFLDAFNLIEGQVITEGLDENSLQGDKIYKKYFSLLGEGTPTLDVKNCPDLAPVLMAVASVKNGCRLINTARLKIKESDRGTAMAQELLKLGGSVEVYENEIIVSRAKLTKPESDIYSHNDHRIAMAMAVILSLTGGRITDAQAVRKSFPDFFEKLRELSLEVDLYDN